MVILMMVTTVTLHSFHQDIGTTLIFDQCVCALSIFVDSPGESQQAATRPRQRRRPTLWPTTSRQRRPRQHQLSLQGWQHPQHLQHLLPLQRHPLSQRPQHLQRHVDQQLLRNRFGTTRRLTEQHSTR